MSPQAWKLAVRAGVLFALAVGLWATASRASNGRVIAAPEGCSDYFVVEEAAGLVVMEWYGGHVPAEGEQIVGDYDSYGFKDVYDVTADQSIHVWIDDFMLSEDSATDKMREHCN